MSAFGIYALVLTFILVLYYIGMICYDLFGTKSSKEDGVEIISSTSKKSTENQNIEYNPEQSNVSETKDGGFVVNEGNGESQASNQPIEMAEGEVIEATAEAIDDVSAEDLIGQVYQNLDEPEVTIEGEETSDDFSTRIINEAQQLDQKQVDFVKSFKEG